MPHGVRWVPGSVTRVTPRRAPPALAPHPPLLLGRGPLLLDPTEPGPPFVLLLVALPLPLPSVRALRRQSVRRMASTSGVSSVLSSVNCSGRWQRHVTVGAQASGQAS